MDVLVQLLLNSIMLGSMYAIIAVGLTLIFGIVRVVNFAHGEFLMIGMYATYLLATKLGWHPYVSAVPITLLLFCVPGDDVPPPVLPPPSAGGVGAGVTVPPVPPELATTSATPERSPAMNVVVA